MEPPGANRLLGKGTEDQPLPAYPLSGVQGSRPMGGHSERRACPHAQQTPVKQSPEQEWGYMLGE